MQTGIEPDGPAASTPAVAVLVVVVLLNKIEITTFLKFTMHLMQLVMLTSLCVLS